MAPVKNWAAIVLAVVSALVLTTNARAAPEDEILFIFNHGSSKHEGQDCYSLIRNFRPAWLNEIAGRTIDGKRIRVYTPCTGYEEGPHPDNDGCGGFWVCRRAIKIAEIIQREIDRGYEPANIFVGGQSAGGWASLLIKRWKPELFNSVITTAPAFNGTRRNRLCKSRSCSDKPAAKWNGNLRRQHNNHINAEWDQVPDIRALIFTFPCDSYARPEELPFPTSQATGVFQSYVYPPSESPVRACANPHKGKNYYLTTQESMGYRRCDNPVIGTQFFIPGGGLYCGSEKKNTPTRNMILNCHPKDKFRCQRDQHTATHRSRDFARHIRASGVVLSYMKQNLRNWQPPQELDNKKTPCSFVTDISRQCPAFGEF